MGAEQELKCFLSCEKGKYDGHRPNPLVTVQGATEILRKACARNGEYDPVGAGNEKAHNLHKDLAEFLFDRKYTSAALEVLVNWWVELGERQSNEETAHIH